MPRLHPHAMNAYRGFQSASGTGFTPLRLNPIAWYRADKGVTGTTSVTAWADQSGNGHHLVTGAAPSLVANSVNNQPGILFDQSSSEYLEVTSGSILVDGCQVWVFFKPTTVSTAMTFVDSSDTASSAIIKCTAAAPTKLTQGASNITTGVISAGATGFFSALWTGTDEISLNDATADTATLTAVTGAGLRVGARGDSASFFLDAEIQELIVTPAEVTGGNKANLLTYRSNRYGS